MSAALKLNLISVEDYLAGELLSQTKHEYVDGIVRAMAGARVTHNVITGNTFGSLFVRLRRKPCRPYASDMKIRIDMGESFRFYYPDVSIICRSNPGTDSFQDEPAVIFEVLSKSTRLIDEGEKKDAYITIPSLRVYVMVEQDSPDIIVYRRTDAGFVRELYQDLDAMLPLGEIGIELPLAEIYEGVEFIPEPSEDDA